MNIQIEIKVNGKVYSIHECHTKDTGNAVIAWWDLLAKFKAHLGCIAFNDLDVFARKNQS